MLRDANLIIDKTIDKRIKYFLQQNGLRKLLANCR